MSHLDLGERELQLLDRLSAILNSLDRPEEVLERQMDLFLAAMGAERGLLLAFEESGEPRPLVVRNLAQDVVDGMASGWSRRAIQEMTGAGQLVISEDVLNDRRFRDSASVVAQNIHSLLCVPIKMNGTLTGAIYIDQRNESRTFSDRDVAFATALAELASVSLERARSLQALHAENDELRRRAARYEFGEVIGASDSMQRLFERLHKAVNAPPEFAILLTGENGTGKTSVAKLIHQQSSRRDSPFMTFGTGSVPESLIESELFGHNRGSFTGANSDRVGLITRADAGTLFLDDVDTLPLSVQPKLLSFLQEREYHQIGNPTKLQADIRIICATNADLEARVADGSFRQDLYYRLNGIPLVVPPLRERKEDIPLLARHFLARYAKAVAKEIRGFTPSALALMMAYAWPGNVRELMSEVVHAVTMSQGPWIDPAEFKSAPLRNGPAQGAPPELNLDAALDATTLSVVKAALATNDGNISRAAKAAGVSRGKFYDLMSRVGLRDKPPRSSK